MKVSADEASFVIALILVLLVLLVMANHSRNKDGCPPGTFDCGNAGPMNN